MTTPKLYEARGDVVHKLPVKVRNETDTGTIFEVGFPVCTASEYVEAATIAAILNEYEHVEPDDAPRPESRTLTEATTRIAGRTHAEWVEFAKRDDAMDNMIPSDLRKILAAFGPVDGGEAAKKTEPQP